MNATTIARLRLLIGCVFIALSPAAFGQLTTNVFNFTNLDVAIPDNDQSGVQNSQIVNGLTGSIADVQVSLNLAGTGDGAFNGDYYVELINSQGGFAVLLNRAGESSANPFGYGDDGFDVTFSDAANNDVHFYQSAVYTLNSGGQLTGTWQPDGENISPLSDPSAFDNALNQATALFSSFDGQNPNDTWTLYAADVSQNGTGQLIDWSLIITTVPEPATTGLLAAGLIFLGAGFWKKQSRLSARR
jgi:subtilisin-like proprotein convertase family protein